MICVSLRAKNLLEFTELIAEAAAYADIIELRLDDLSLIDEKELQHLVDHSPLPLLLTLRTKTEGGNYEGSENQYTETLLCLGRLKPAFLDVEWHVSCEWKSQLAKSCPGVKLICSYHNHTETPLNLDKQLDQMKHPAMHAYKLAVMSCSTTDMLRLMNWAVDKDNIIPVSMGDFGSPGRVIAPVVGSLFVFASLDEAHQTASGQISVKRLNDLYGIRRLNRQTKLYGLIGNPVHRSVGDVFHNHALHQMKKNGVYIKMAVRPEELETVWSLCQTLPFYGLSVTMPLKERMLFLADELSIRAREIGAVNTLSFQAGKWIGDNTDAAGALNPLERIAPVKNRRVVILGAGGAARAIAYEAISRGAKVTIVNRNEQKARELATLFDCDFCSLENFRMYEKKEYNFLINTTPLSMPIEEKDLLPETIAMDINTANDSEFLEQALKKNCRVVQGMSMFTEQAKGQLERWFG